MVSAMDSGLGSPGLSPEWHHYAVLGKTLLSKCLSPARSINGYWQMIGAT